MESLFSFSAKKKLLQGICKVAEPLKSTFGTGETSYFNLALEKDPFVNLGVSFAKSTIESQEKTCLDGKKLSLLFLESIVKGGLSFLEKGGSPFSLQEELLETKKVFFSFLEEKALFFTDPSWITQGSFFEKEDPLFIKALFTSSKEQFCFIQTEKEPYFKEEKGVFLPHGIASPLFFKKKSPPIEIKNPLCFITVEISSLEKLFSCLQKEEPIFLVTEKICPDVLATLIFHALENKKEIFPIIVPNKKALSTFPKIEYPQKEKGFFKMRKGILFPEKTLFFLQENAPSFYTFFTKNTEEKQTLFSVLHPMIQEGFVEGGASFLVKAALYLETKERSSGSLIIQKALRIPFYHLVQNHARDPKALIEELKKEVPFSGFDRKTGAITNLKKERVFDSVYLIKKAFSHALQKALEVFFIEGIISC